jgi:quinol monooxygenase YgiN
MKGISYITDRESRKKAVVIDLKTLQKYDNEVADLLDTIIAESRAEEPTISWEKVKKSLKKRKKL